MECIKYFYLSDNYRNMSILPIQHVGVSLWFFNSSDFNVQRRMGDGLYTGEMMEILYLE